jgi:hypothetical protein
MQGSSGTHGGLVHLLAGAALGAVVVLVVWIFSGGRPFGDVVATTSDVRPPTPAAVQQSAVQRRADAPAATRAKLEKAPPSLGGGSAELRFSRPAAKRRAKAAKAQRAVKAKRKARRARRPRPVVRVVAPPPSEVPVAAVPSPAPSAAPAPPASPRAGGGGGKPVKPRAPALSVGAGEG